MQELKKIIRFNALIIVSLLVIGCSNKKTLCPESGPMRPDFGSTSNSKKRDKNGHIKKKQSNKITKH